MSITTIGRQRLASHGANTPSQNLITHVALGTDDTEATVNDVALGAEIYRVVIGAISAEGATIRTYTLIVAVDIGNSSYTIEEIGLLDAASGGNLICRQKLSQPVTIAGTQRVEILYGIPLT